MSAKRKRITDATLRALKPAPKGKRAEIFDAVVTDFGVRSTDKGIHSFIYYALRAVAMSARSRRIAAFVRPYLAELGLKASRVCGVQGRLPTAQAGLYAVPVPG
jgi:hypothetical protein